MSQHTLTLLRFTYKKLKEKLTVSDSKKLFHEQFPYIIPALYKRIVDEILVELNLLNHQSEFSQDYLFCIGLTETFKELLKGYEPEKHLDLLFDSLCSSSNFEGKKIKEISQKSQLEFKDKSSEEILKLLKEKYDTKLYPSRILILGMYILISESHDLKGKNETEINKAIINIFESLNLPTNKVEKDIGIYKSSISKLKQAKELIEELRLKDKKKDIKR
ncbi:photosystem II biogenesis protein Psp29 [Prochlorococcus marinus str. MU1402]|uniref:photosystem II biogenesis protein Psp29 n=1 Tax=Prochlorococcus marinus TaxID=1219 RepID=UPI001ADA670A|nr:photosystem II biogenesis protein Psp29 [Prochlorococcus marinus]MBO8231808.1 photosystem II biogenesis protein Psp29 [Prochlorococcus marinus XMU1402]MBW3056557.1 photosystem II biogenesis protein Psp29 [Prochlorococcus marinus str. MU1402]